MKVLLNAVSPQRLRRAALVARLLVRLRLFPTPDTTTSIVEFAIEHVAIRPSQHRAELLELCRIVAELKPKVVLEIGTANGGTLFPFARLADPYATIISIDQVPYTRLRVALFRAFCGKQQRFHAVAGDSKLRSTLRKAQAISAFVDFLFIDGAHDYETVKSDFSTYSPLVRKGGVIAMHDIASHRLTDCDVPRLWAEIKTLHRHKEIIEDATREWGGIGVLYV